ncbi:MAG: LuxR family transcriptional regulator [Marmoricola sp.]|nr:LuxR family transcriptional regulator [Marmoricola sp.]
MSPEDGSRQRGLLQGPAGEIFREVVKAGLLEHDDARLSDGHPDHEAVQLLVDLGLLRHDTAAGGWVAVDPATVQPGVVAPLGRRVVQLLDESAAWADVLGGLGQSFRRTPPNGDSKVTEIRGLPNINRFLDAAVDDAESQLLTAQPAGARRAAVLEQAVDRDIRALQRGVRMRTLYQHTARRSKATRQHVARTMEHGAQVRTLDEFFNRLILIDDRLAVIPGDQPEVALAIHEPGIISYLADVFERSWERGRDYEDRAEASESDIAAEVRQLTVRMLSEGHSDPASAKRVGVSTRTYASYVAALKEEYGVETRFQLGYAMGSRAASEDSEPPRQP